jgi:dihydroflavonol-4-reductase
MSQTILLTGASGYIAKHIALQLLNAGFVVRASLRNLDRANELRAALAPHLTAALADRLTFVALDLEQDAGWDTALAGVDVLMHTASPFPMSQPKNPDDLIRPAVQGALRALRAAKAAGVMRVIMTSSSAAITGGPLPPGKVAFDEVDWTNPDAPGTSAYTQSKTLAERAAWDFVRDHAPDMQLTVINPVFVIGPPLDRHFGTSVSVIERLLNARDPMIPQFGFPTVDVRDVALAHLRALTSPGTAGKRYIVSDRFLWFGDIADILKSNFPTRRIVTRRAPNFVVRILGLFDKAIAGIVPILGKREEVSGVRAQSELGISFRDVRVSTVETAQFLIDQKLVK